MDAQFNIYHMPVFLLYIALFIVGPTACTLSANGSSFKTDMMVFVGFLS